MVCIYHTCVYNILYVYIIHMCIVSYTYIIHVCMIYTHTHLYILKEKMGERFRRQIYFKGLAHEVRSHGEFKIMQL